MLFPLINTGVADLRNLIEGTRGTLLRGHVGKVTWGQGGDSYLIRVALRGFYSRIIL